MKPSTLLEHSTCWSTSRTLVRILPLLAARRHADHHSAVFTLVPYHDSSRNNRRVGKHHASPAAGDPRRSRRTPFAVAMRSCRCIAPKRYGRCVAEAMALGKPVIGTGWSGNLDFMNAETACLVDFRLITVKKDEYTGRFGRNRTWSRLLIGGPMIQSPRWAAELGQKASRHCSYRARGMAMPPRSCRVARPR